MGKPQSKIILSRARLSKLVAEGKQSPADEYREMAKRWKNLAVLERHTVAEKYVAGCVALVCDLNLSLAGGNENVPKAIRDGFQFADDKRIARLVFKADVPDALEMNLGNEEFVLVQNVESVKFPNGLPIPSSVRLYDVLDEVADPLRGLMFKSAIDGVFHFLPGIFNRKLRELSPLPSSSEFNIASRVVQSGPQIVDCVPNNTHHPFRHTFKWDDVKAIITSVEIVLDGNIVRFSALKGGKLRAKFTDVLFGPLDF